MKWLLTYPEDGPSVAFYKRFVRDGCRADPILIDQTYSDPGDLSEFDALLLSGGGDIHPSRYGDTQIHPNVYGVIPRRDELEFRLIRAFIDTRRPIFGICRGIQILNVFLGGGLIQHVPDFIAESEERHIKPKDDEYDAMHGLAVVESTRLGAALKGVDETNSAHHQAIDPNRLGNGLVIAARSPLGIIEAVESTDPGLRISAVQWHPERLPLEHPASIRLADHWRSVAGASR